MQDVGLLYVPGVVAGGVRVNPHARVAPFSIRSNMVESTSPIPSTTSVTRGGHPRVVICVVKCERVPLTIFVFLESAVSLETLGAAARYRQCGHNRLSVLISAVRRTTRPMRVRSPVIMPPPNTVSSAGMVFAELGGVAHGAIASSAEAAHRRSSGTARRPSKR